MKLLIFLAVAIVVAIVGSLAWFFRSTGPRSPDSKATGSYHTSQEGTQRR